RFPSLDSLILSKSDRLNPATSNKPSDKATALANQVHDILHRKSSSPSGRPKLSLHTVSSNAGDDEPAVSKQFIYDDDKYAALFVPAFTLLGYSGLNKGLQDNELDSAINANPQLRRDIDASVLVGSLLPKFRDEPLFEGANQLAEQAYFITTTGVTRMWQNN